MLTRWRPAPRTAYAVVFAVCAVVVIGRLALGVVAVLADQSAQLRQTLAAPAAGAWGRALLVVPVEPTRQTLIELGFNLLDMGLALVILARRGQDRPMRALALGMLAVGGTGNLWMEATATAVQRALGLPSVATGDTLLLSVAFAGFALALLTYPPTAGRALSTGRDETLLVGAGAVVLSAAAAWAIAPALRYVVLLGLALPAVGLVLLRHRGRDDLTADERTQLRMLYSLLVTAATIATTTVVVTVVVWSTGWVGLTLADPTAPAGEPALLRQTTLLFWFCRLMPVAIAVGARTAGRREQLYATQRRLSLGLVVALVATVIGGLFVVLHTVLTVLARGSHLPAGIAGTSGAVVAAVPAALLLPATYVRVESWVDRLLNGQRPSPYSVLAGIGSVTRAGVAGTRDLAWVAESVGRGLGARLCRLTVHRPNFSDRTYVWSDAGADPTDALFTVPIMRDDERLGSITVDRAAVAGLHVNRQRLLEDVADSLVALLDADRLGIELDRQLQAAGAHAAEIAASRRRLVAEMDAERRRIERDLHDGAQHHLVTLRLSLGLLEHQLATGRTEQAKGSFERVTRQIDDAESVMARTATGVTSPLLAEQGLVRALEAELASAEPPVHICADGIGEGREFPAEVASAVWFCCLEAVGNARKHAPGASIRLYLRRTGPRLEFGVHDDGPGWDQSTGDSLGRGMRNVLVRVTAVGGRLSVQTEPGAGTRVDGWVPVSEQPTAGLSSPDHNAAEEPVIRDEALVEGVRSALEEALTSYGSTAGAARVRKLRANLDLSPEPSAGRSAAIRTAWDVLGGLAALVRDEPPPDDADVLAHRLEQIRSSAFELAEVEAIETLRSGACDLDPDDTQRAVRLLGEFGRDPRSRLGLASDADSALVVAAARRALVSWRTRASHPATALRLRTVAATVVRSCERLLQTR